MNKRSVNKLWFFLFPLLFIPNLGEGIATNYGQLEVSDFLVIGFLGLLTIQTIGNRQANKLSLFHQILPLLIVFIWWGLLVILLIPLRYNYSASSQMLFALLKLAKFTLFVVTGLAITRLLQSEEARQYFHWSLLGIGTVISFSILINSQESSIFTTYAELSERVYVDNLISVTLAMLICYIGGSIVSGYGSSQFRTLGAVSILLMMVGIFSTSGRGGWIALVVGVLYIVYRRQSKRIFTFALLSLLAVIYAYTFIPSFEYEVSRTLWPDEAQLAHLERDNAEVADYDDGKRLTIWVNESKKIIDSPILGTGFFHRGGQTRLHPTGSHNFFIQMFLETGIVGGALIISLLGLMWKQAGAYAVDSRPLYFEVPFKACLLAAIAGAIGGEYFYGGQALLLLFSIYSVVGSFELRVVPRSLFPLYRKRLALRQQIVPNNQNGFSTLSKSR